MLLLCGVALCVVHLRAEQARVAAEILSSEARRVELRREMWTLQMSVARLRTPAQIRDRVERLTLARFADGDRVKLAWNISTAESAEH